MKLKLFTLSAFILLTFSLQAQTDEIYKKIAKETCECIAKKNINYATTSKAEVQMTLGLCMMEAAQNNKLEMDMENTQAMTELGQKVGLQMAPLCPEVFKAFLNKEETEEAVEEETEDETEYFTVSGKVKLVEEKDFVYITLKETGKEQKFAWLWYFEGSDEFKDDPKKLVGKDVTLTYIMLEVLQPKSKVYYNLNVISALEKK